MQGESLEQWLSHLATLHPFEIDLGLERVREVGHRLELCNPAATVITVAGTNGKGSVCAMLEAFLHAQGLRTGLYTSPHLFRFNERVRVDGNDIDDASLCRAFAQIEAARGTTTLTEFEFVTLAALQIFRTHTPDVIILEVGLGGRLDATNIVDADVAVVTTIGLDHEAWLGSDIDVIAREKAGIARAGRPAVCGDPGAPATLEIALRESGARVLRAGRDFSREPASDSGHWHWLSEPGGQLRELPAPALVGGYQIDNAATALAALDAAGLRPTAEQAASGLCSARVPGRFQLIPGPVPTILDVAHNPQAAEKLGCTLRDQPCTGRTHLVLGMLSDKDHEGVIDALAPHADYWYCASLAPPRGLDAGKLARIVRQAPDRECEECPAPSVAYNLALQRSRPGDRIVIAGSFVTVAQVGPHFL